MATTVFEQEKSVFFSMDEDDSTSDAGGCTQAWWDGQCPNGTEAETAAAMAKLMDGTGTPLIEMADCVYTESNNRITKTNIAAGVEVGMVAYIIESDTPDEYVETGRYVITARDPGDDDWIECDGIESDDDTDVDVVIGGAFDTLQNALDETDASDHSVTIYVQSVDTLGATLDIDSGDGNVTKNTFKRLVGFNTSPGDMNYGGTYYQSPLEILQAGSIDLSKCVTLDADGGAFDVLMFGASMSNCIIENIHFTGTTGNGVEFADDFSVSIIFRNCRLSDMYQGVNSTVSHLVFQDCYSHDDVTSHAYVFRGPDGLLSGCVANLAAGAVLTNIIAVPGAVIGCITVGGMYGVRPVSAGSAAVVIGNTFYNLTQYGIMAEVANRVVAFNNIFCLAPGAVGLHCNSGSIVYNDYNCFIESDGTPLTVGDNGSGYEVPVKGKHSVQVDPDFVDAANGDFRVRNPLVLRGGRPGPDGRAAVIGAIGQEYQFAQRARIMNAGRAGIVR